MNDEKNSSDEESWYDFFSERMMPAERLKI